MKNRDLLAYTRDLVYLMYQMSIGNSIQGDPAIERLVYLRTVKQFSDFLVFLNIFLIILDLEVC